MQNIWIVGASAGIGESLALKYAQNKNNVAISARNSQKLDEILLKMNEFSGQNSNNLSLPLDVCDKKQIENAFEEIIAKWGKIDLFIFMSGIYQPMKALEIDAKLAKETINVNLTSIFDFLPLLIAQMQKQKGGKIALTASVAGYRGLPNSLAYGASKAGLINLCETLNSELASENIEVCVINPGFVKTRLTDKNNFKMPFIIDANEAAEIIYREIKTKKFEIHFPKKFTFFMKILKILPNWLFLKITRKIAKNS